MQCLGDILRHNALVFSKKTFLIQDEMQLSYRQVNERANSLVHGLHHLGVKYGDRVALLSRNEHRFIELYFGLPKIGVIFVPLNYWSTADDLVSILNQCQARVLIFAPEFFDIAVAIKQRLSALQHLVTLDDQAPASVFLSVIPYEHLVDKYPSHEPEVEINPDDDILILYTSGSTGQPKGAVYTHRGLLYAAVIMSIELGIRETDITLHFLPIFSSNLEHLLPFGLVGATHIIMRKFDPKTVWETVARRGVTHFDSVPTLMRLLLNFPELINYDTSSLRLVSYASEPMPAAIITSWLETFPHVEAVQFYGMIEFLCMTVLKPWEQLTKLGTVGKLMLGNDLRIVDAAGREVPVGIEGEVVCRSLCAMRGYWRESALTHRVLRAGWMYTGDIGKLDEDGYLTLVGRKKDIIITGGMNVVPTEVEEILYRHPAVAEAVVIGRPDDAWGEAVHAVVALNQRGSVTAEELIAFCAKSLAGYKKPRSVEFLPSLPKTGIGKISRKVLQDRYQEVGNT